jgi:hypothetical protein
MKLSGVGTRPSHLVTPFSTSDHVALPHQQEQQLNHAYINPPDNDLYVLQNIKSPFQASLHEP